MMWAMSCLAGGVVSSIRSIHVLALAGDTKAPSGGWQSDILIDWLSSVEVAVNAIEVAVGEGANHVQLELLLTNSMRSLSSSVMRASLV